MRTNLYLRIILNYDYLKICNFDTIFSVNHSNYAILGERLARSCQFIERFTNVCSRSLDVVYSYLFSLQNQHNMIIEFQLHCFVCIHECEKTKRIVHMENQDINLDNYNVGLCRDKVALTPLESASSSIAFSNSITAF